MSPFRKNENHSSVNDRRADHSDGHRLRVALCLIGLYLVGEIIVGLVAHSLALLSDAAHMLTDVAGLVLALVAIWFAKRPASGRFTYGFRRVEILSAQANGLVLLGLSVILVVEAVHRLIRPPRVTGPLVLAVALIGVVVNLVATWSMSKADRTSLNIEGAFQHIATDLLGFVATALAGVVIIVGHWQRADPVATLVVVVMMVRSGVGLVRESGRVFLEGAPANLDASAVGATLAAVPGVAEVHDLHIWEITTGMPAVSAHVLVESGYDCHEVQHQIQDVLRRQYQLDHSTLQVEHTQPALQITLKPNPDQAREH